MPAAAAQWLIGAFRNANLVALGERHWAREDSEFRLKLVRDPAFARTAADIVVEFANPLHQHVLNRYVNGEGVRAAELRRIWQDTTQPGTWDSPVYEEFLRAICEVNRGLPPAGRIRILAGDQPIDWSRSPLTEWKDERDSFAASVIEREVLNRDRKALVLFGSAHLYRNRPGTIVDRLQRHPTARWCVVVPISGPDAPSAILREKGSPSNPEIVATDSSVVGDLYANDVFEKGTKRVQLVDGKPLLMDGRPVWVPVQIFAAHLKVRQVADACLYFGNTAPAFVPPPTLYPDTTYGKEIQRRRASIHGPR